MGEGKEGAANVRTAASLAVVSVTTPAGVKGRVWGKTDRGMRGEAGCAGCRRRLGKEECQLLSQQLPSSACLNVYKCVGLPGHPLPPQ